MALRTRRDRFRHSASAGIAWPFEPSAVRSGAATDGLAPLTRQVSALARLHRARCSIGNGSRWRRCDEMDQSLVERYEGPTQSMTLPAREITPDLLVPAPPG
jgi:hypothetical protein